MHNAVRVQKKVFRQEPGFFALVWLNKKLVGSLHCTYQRLASYVQHLIIFSATSCSAFLSATPAAYNIKGLADYGRLSGRNSKARASSGKSYGPLTVDYACKPASFQVIHYQGFPVRSNSSFFARRSSRMRFILASTLGEP